jgi:hypothetical protein
MTTARKREPRGPHAELPDAFEQGVAEAMPGLWIVDRGLDLENGHVADLVGVDPLGHLVLVLFVEQDEESVALLALDALAFARHNMPLFPRHFGTERLRASLPPKIAMVGPAFADRTRQRLAPLLEAGVMLFELRTLKSASGEQTYLVRAHETRDAEEYGCEPFLESLPPEGRETAETVAERMELLDEDLVLRAEGGQLVWSLGEEIVARLEADRGRLRGSVPPSPHVRGVDGPADVERFLGEAMRRFAELLNGHDDGPKAPQSRVESRVESPVASLGILTAEEIEAFRQ